MAKYIAIFTDQVNEIEVSGFKIMTEKEVDAFERLAESITWDFNYSLPSEDGELSFSSGEDLLGKIDFKEVSNEEFKSIKRIFEGEFGIFVNLEYLETIIGDEDLEEDDCEDEDLEEDDYEDDFDEYN